MIIYKAIRNASTTGTCTPRFRPKMIHVGRRTIKLYVVFYLLSICSLAVVSLELPRSEHDDRTLLDIFGESAKQYLTQNVIPPTDPECQWDWRSVRCEPYCQCDFSPKWGDYHLGRSCRLATKEICNSMPNSLQMIIQQMVQGSKKLITTTENAAISGYRKIQKHVCEEMPEVQCSENGELPLIAWQERLLCHHKIPSCEGMAESNEKGEEQITSTASNDESDTTELLEDTLESNSIENDSP